MTEFKAGDKAILKNLKGRKYNLFVCLDEGELVTILDSPSPHFPKDAVQIKIKDNGFGAIDSKCLEKLPEVSLPIINYVTKLKDDLKFVVEANTKLSSDLISLHQQVNRIIAIANKSLEKVEILTTKEK